MLLFYHNARFWDTPLLLLQVDDFTVQMIVVEDLSYHAGYSLVSGRFPLLHSEVVLDNITLSTIGKNVGDWVTIRSGDYEYDYIISGSVQLMGSFVGMMRADGLRRVQPDFSFINFGLYLTGGREDTALFMETTEAANSDIIARISSLHGHIDNILGAMGNLLTVLVIVIILVVIAVVLLVLYLIIKTIIVRRKRELGIQKAFGFTTLQLMNQISLSLTPTIIFGVALGAIGSYIGFNPIFVALMRGAGIAQVDLPMPINWIVMVSVALILLAYAVSMIISWKIRKISAYALVTEC
jgi:putative ABC transport system permease protein